MILKMFYNGSGLEVEKPYQLPLKIVKHSFERLKYVFEETSAENGTKTVS